MSRRRFGWTPARLGHGRGWVGSVVQLAAAIAAVSSLSLVLGASAQAAVVHEIGFTKGCDSPTKIGDPVVCGYTVRNTIDQAHDSTTIVSLVDTVNSVPPDVSGNLLSTGSLTTTTVDTGNVQ